MRNLLRYGKGYRKEAVLGPFLKLCEAALELLIPYVVMAIVNAIDGDRAAAGGLILKNALLLVGMGLLGLVFSVSAQFFSAKAAVGFASRLREALFSHVAALSYREIDRVGRSTLITRLTSDVNQIQTAVNLFLRLLLRSPFIVFGAMIMAFTIDAEAAMVFVVTIPILAAVVLGLLILCLPLYRRVQERLDAVLLKTRENLLGVRTLRALGREESERKEFKEKNDALDRLQRFVGRISALLNPLTYVLIHLAVVALLYRGAIRVQYGLLSQAAVLALYHYMSQILVELIKLANLIITITQGLAGAHRVEAILALPTEEVGGEAPEGEAPDGETAVVFSDVSFGYAAGGADAIRSVSFSVKPGETVGIIGATGAGKSTLIHLLCGFYQPREGSVTVFGRSASEMPRGAWLSQFGIVPQQAALFRGTVRSNLFFGGEADDGTAWEALKTAQAADFVAEKGGLDAPVEQGGRNFSGGQRQRLTIARALMKKAPILILDDSASALDAATDLSLRRAIRALPHRPTVFLISQRATALNGADRILVLEEGRLSAVGTHETLVQTCPVYREICLSQSMPEKEAAE